MDPSCENIHDTWKQLLNIKIVDKFTSDVDFGLDD